ncbi:hypothetical protein [Arhodomonas sp. AD133]|uniref:hypothetical protein n=1 Tax=Arhodomonas sp. AD133 TaxID=3415009 RepID=UPI003EBCD80D
MPQVIALADSRERLAFFRRMRTGLAELGASLHVVTPYPSLVRAGRRAGLTVTRIPAGSPDVACEGTDTSADRRTQRLRTGTQRVLERLTNNAPLNLLLIWDGSQPAGSAAGEVATRDNVPVLYLQPPQLPGHLMVDPEGTDTTSSVARNPDLLDRFPVAERDFLRWHGLYRTRRRESASVPASVVEPTRTPGAWLDRLMSLTGQAPIARPPTVRGQRRRHKAIQAVLAQLHDPLPGDYALYVMQPDDDPALRNGQTPGPTQGLDRALRIAREQGLPLVVRFDHRQRDPRRLAGLVARLRSSRDVYLTSQQCYPLVEYARLVITVNDAEAVLDARVLERPLIALGPSLIAELPERRLAQLILGYSVPVDYYSHQSIASEAIVSMLRRLPPAQFARFAEATTTPADVALTSSTANA